MADQDPVVVSVKVCAFCVDKAQYIDYKDVASFAVLSPSAVRYCLAELQAHVQSISVGLRRPLKSKAGSFAALCN